MILNNKYRSVFERVPIFGMIHLAGENPVKRALEEISIFEEEGLSGAIIENYHGCVKDVVETLKETSKIKKNIKIGVNILPNEFHLSLHLAKKYMSEFVQLDQVAGNYTSGKINFGWYESVKRECSKVIVLGGVWPKYYVPIEGSRLERDLQMGVQRAEAIVVTGSGTGVETPLEKIKKFREIIGEHPLVIGAGINLDNAYEQLIYSDGAIIGSSLKIKNETFNSIDRKKVRDLMSIVKEVRTYDNF